VTSGEGSLDGEPTALVWREMSFGFPWDLPCSDLWALDRRALRAAHPLVGVFGPRDGHVPAADALCRAPFEGSTRLVSTAASSKDDDIVESERLAPTPCPFRQLSLADEGRRKPTPAICTIHEHHRDLPSPVPAAHEVALAIRLPGWTGPLRDLTSRASSVQGP
jgi:hypothetical protein